MYGWRGRLGLILGMPNVVCEMECHDMAPDGMSVNGVRMNIHPVAIYSEPKVMKEIEEEVTRLSGEIKGVKPDIVLFTHCSASMASVEFDQKINDIMAKESGAQGLTSARALVEALNAVEAKKIGVADPFPKPELSAIVNGFLQDPAVGFEVVNHAAAKGASPSAIGALPPSAAYQFGRQADHPDADAIVLTSNVWQTIEIIEDLEEDLGKPVISATQAMVWAALRMMGVGVSAAYGAGSLFDID